MCACVWQSSVYSEKKSQTDTLAAGEAEETGFSVLTVVLLLHCLAEQMHFLSFLVKHTGAARVCEVVEEEATIDAPCFSVLTGEAST